jgi:hypothetical protein
MMPSYPTDEQLAAALKSTRGHDVVARHFTSSGLIVTETRWFGLIAVDRDGNVIKDTPIR